MSTASGQGWASQHLPNKHIQKGKTTEQRPFVSGALCWFGGKQDKETHNHMLTQVTEKGGGETLQSSHFSLACGEMAASVLAGLRDHQRRKVLCAARGEAHAGAGNWSRLQGRPMLGRFSTRRIAARGRAPRLLHKYLEDCLPWQRCHVASGEDCQFSLKEERVAEETWSNWDWPQPTFPARPVPHWGERVAKLGQERREGWGRYI